MGARPSGFSSGETASRVGSTSKTCPRQDAPGKTQATLHTGAMTDISRLVLDWYDANARVLPWRMPPGSRSRPDPYRIWLSEIMLQQTTVAAVIPYFTAFTQRWPRVEDLAGAPLEDVLSAWAGLGYYARARNLHACAGTVRDTCGGQFPDAEDALRALPGIGAYTAAAIAAIAFGARAVVVDGNVERVMARLHGVATPLPDAKPELKRLAAGLTPAHRCGDYVQGLMDLGATICTPRSPDCTRCPLSGACVALAKGIAATLPAKRPKAEKPTRTGLVFWITRPCGAVLVRTRPPKGLLAKMPEFPSAGWATKDTPAPDLDRDAPCPGPWTLRSGEVRHTFTHFHLRLQIAETRIAADRAEDLAHRLDGRWMDPDALAALGLPTVMRKVADVMTAGDGPLFADAPLHTQEDLPTHGDRDLAKT